MHFALGKPISPKEKLTFSNEITSLLNSKSEILKGFTKNNKSKVIIQRKLNKNQ